jgi:hypothetical protein
VRGAGLAALALTLAGCEGDAGPQAIDRIEIRFSGRLTEDVIIERGGRSHFELNRPLPDGKTGFFRVTPAQFDEARRRLEPFRRHAVPVTAETSQAILRQICPAGVPFVYDAGAVYVRWAGPGVDQHYLADLGCDRERQAGRNRDLIAILNSLPVPREQAIG